jgi:hypothetical protein
VVVEEKFIELDCGSTCAFEISAPSVVALDAPTKTDTLVAAASAPSVAALDAPTNTEMLVAAVSAPSVVALDAPTNTEMLVAAVSAPSVVALLKLLTPSAPIGIGVKLAGLLDVGALTKEAFGSVNAGLTKSCLKLSTTTPVKPPRTLRPRFGP